MFTWLLKLLGLMILLSLFMLIPLQYVTTFEVQGLETAMFSVRDQFSLHVDNGEGTVKIKGVEDLTEVQVTAVTWAWGNSSEGAQAHLDQVELTMEQQGDRISLHHHPSTYGVIRQRDHEEGFFL